jgi:hypothetical protein
MGVKAGCTPRSEVLEGELNDAIFAASFGRLIRDEGPAVSREPALFFRNTYPTDALRGLCKRVFGPLADPAEAGRFFRLSTGFGGGKTHALMALWHLAKNIADPTMGTHLLPPAGRPPKVHVVGVDAEGVGYPVFSRHGDQEAKSLAAELAFQLGGPSALNALGPANAVAACPDEKTVDGWLPLAGREHINEKALAELAQQIKNDPTIIEAFPDEEAADPAPEPPLIGPEETETLLAALDGSGIEVRAETNTRHVIGEAPLRIVTDAGAIPLHPDAACVDGLDQRQWALLRQLQRPGERLPLLLVSIEVGAFTAMTCGWIDGAEMNEVRSFADLKRLVAEWDGTEPPIEAWNAARIVLEDRARTAVEQSTMRAKRINAGERAQQREAARLRLIEELGRFLVCFPPDTDDLNGKFHRLASEATPTAERLKIVYSRLGAYPDWDEDHLAELRAFRSTLASSQIRSRLAGRELDAALADPR